MNSILAVTITSAGLIQAVLALAAAAGVTGWLTKKDSGIEERRRQAIDFASVLDSLGLDILSNLVKSYAVGDYGSVLAAVKTLYLELKTPEALLERLRTSFKKQLTARLANPDEAAHIVEAVRPLIAKMEAEKPKKEAETVAA